MDVSTENFRFRLEKDLKDLWVGLCERKNISQQDAIAAVLKFVLEQEELTQSMLLGQIPASEDVIAVVLRRLARARESGSDSAAAFSHLPLQPITHSGESRDENGKRPAKSRRR